MNKNPRPLGGPAFAQTPRKTLSYMVGVVMEKCGLREHRAGPWTQLMEGLGTKQCLFPNIQGG